MSTSYSPEQARAYLERLRGQVEQGRIRAALFPELFSLHGAVIRTLDFDLAREEIRMEIACVDWLRENTGVVNPYLPERLVFRDAVQFYYKNREERSEPRIFDCRPLTVSELLLESETLYAERERSGRPKICLDVQMPLDDSELVILCSALELHTAGRVVVVVP